MNVFTFVVILCLSVAQCAVIRLNWGQSVKNQGTTTIKVGDTVQWVWIDSKQHSVSSLGTPAFTSSPVTKGLGSVYTVVFTAAGKYSYHCSVHATMKGVVSVTA